MEPGSAQLYPACRLDNDRLQIMLTVSLRRLFLGMRGYVITVLSAHIHKHTHNPIDRNTFEIASVCSNHFDTRSPGWLLFFRHTSKHWPVLDTVTSQKHRHTPTSMHVSQCHPSRPEIKWCGSSCWPHAQTHKVTDNKIGRQIDSSHLSRYVWTTLYRRV